MPTNEHKLRFVLVSNIFYPQMQNIIQRLFFRFNFSHYSFLSFNMLTTKKSLERRLEVGNYTRIVRHIDLKRVFCRLPVNNDQKACKVSSLHNKRLLRGYHTPNTAFSICFYSNSINICLSKKF